MVTVETAEHVASTRSGGRCVLLLPLASTLATPEHETIILRRRDLSQRRQALARGVLRDVSSQGGFRGMLQRTAQPRQRTR